MKNLKSFIINNLICALCVLSFIVVSGLLLNSEYLDDVIASMSATEYAECCDAVNDTADKEAIVEYYYQHFAE